MGDRKERTISNDGQQAGQPTLALTLSGGGARAAYQVGVLRVIARRYPDLQIPLLTGVSAGAINISHLACFEGRLPDSMEALTVLWQQLKLENVFRTGGLSLFGRTLKVGFQLSLGLPSFIRPVHGMVDTEPLRDYLHRALKTKDGSLPGVRRNIAAGRLQGVPLLFPPVNVDGTWYGDGGVRLNAPLGPAVHMGAQRLMVISTQYAGESTAAVAETEPPSPATVLAAMYNAVFLDQLDQDVRHMQRINRLVHQVREEDRGALRDIRLLVIQPSQDLGALAFDLRDRLPRAVRHLMDRFGGDQAESDDFLSTMLFHPEYVQRLIAMGEQDADAQAEQIAEFLGCLPGV